MANIVFTEASGVADSIYGNCQAPIKLFLEKRGEDFEKYSALKHLFDMGTSENFGDLFTSMTAMDEGEPVGEMGAYPQTGFREGYQKLLVYETWKQSFKISEEMMDDSKIMDLTKRPEAFITAWNRGRERFGASLYGAAIAGNSTFAYKGKTFDATCADGNPLFYASHPNKITGTTQSNVYSDAFSASALGALESAMHLFTGDNDEILDVAPDTILIPEIASLKNAVLAAVGADKDPATANNAWNYQYGRWNIIVWPYLNAFVASGTAPWILLDSKYNDTYGGAPWIDRKPLTVKSSIDENTDANVWRGRARYNATFNDWRFAAIAGISGASSL